MTMGDIIYTRRKALKMTQEELGQKIGVQKSAIRKYEKGSVENLKTDTIQKLCLALEISPNTLFGWKD